MTVTRISTCFALKERIVPEIRNPPNNSSSDFLSNLLVLLLRVMNVGLSDSGLLTHLSEATAGSLSGIGHSTAYEELATYSLVSLRCIEIGSFSDDGHSLAVNYLFMTDHGSNEHPELVVHDFDANTELNDYEVSHTRSHPNRPLASNRFPVTNFHRSPGRYAI